MQKNRQIGQSNRSICKEGAGERIIHKVSETPDKTSHNVIALILTQRKKLNIVLSPLTQESATLTGSWPRHPHSPVPGWHTPRRRTPSHPPPRLKLKIVGFKNIFLSSCHIIFFCRPTRQLTPDIGICSPQVGNYKIIRQRILYFMPNQ